MAPKIELQLRSLQVVPSRRINFRTPANNVGLQGESYEQRQLQTKPIYGFVEPRASTKFEITRTAGPPKEDKFVVQFVSASPDEVGAENTFKATSPLGEVNFPVIS